jgi:hypothetical protein
MRLRRIGNHRGYYEVIPSSEKPKLPKPPSRRQVVNAWASKVVRHYGDMMGDWAVAGMTDEERDQYIGGGSRKLEKQARDSMLDGLCDAMLMMNVPDHLLDSVRRAVLRLMWYV